MSDKMLAEWFWCDRWMGSSAFLLPMEARGVYREMLTQAWRRGARLPADHGAIRRAIGADEGEWARSWPLIEQFWTVEGDSLVNETQVEVYADSIKRHGRNQARTAAATEARKNRNVERDVDVTKNVTSHPPSLDPSPLLPERIPTNPTSSPLQAQKRRDDVEEARGTLRAALREVEGRHPGLTHQQILDLPQFRAPSGPVRLETCAHGPLMLATAAKIRAPIMRGAKRNGAPSWDRPDTESADLQARAVEWTAANWPRWAGIERREDLEATLAGLSPPPDLAGEIRTHLLFGLYPHLTHQQPQEGNHA